jgi:hypothetical protein
MVQLWGTPWAAQRVLQLATQKVSVWAPLTAWLWAWPWVMATAQQWATLWEMESGQLKEPQMAHP